MMPPRARTFVFLPFSSEFFIDRSIVLFMGLNGVRFLSLVSLILVFASTIFVMVTNIKAVNAFQAHQGNASDLLNCDYIE